MHTRTYVHDKYVITCVERLVHLHMHRHGQTDGQADGRTDIDQGNRWTYTIIDNQTDIETDM